MNTPQSLQDSVPNGVQLEELAFALSLDSGHALHFASVQPYGAVERASIELLDRLGEEIEVIPITLKPPLLSPIESLIEAIHDSVKSIFVHGEVDTGKQKVYFVFGLSEVLGAENRFANEALFRLNSIRDDLLTLHGSTLFWLKPETLHMIASRTPDIWSWTTTVSRLIYEEVEENLTPRYLATPTSEQKGETAPKTSPQQEATSEILSALPSYLQEVIVLKDIYGLSEEEIAKRLNMSESAVRRALLRAHQILRKHLTTT